MTRKVITPYFSHDANARNSDRLLAVRIKHGAEGYGIYFMIMERLREESDYTSSTNYDVMAYDFRVDSEKIRSIVEDFGLFEFNEDGSRFYSPDFNERMEMKDKNSEKLSRAGKVAANKRWRKKNNNSSNSKYNKNDDDDDDVRKLVNESENIKESCDDNDLSSNLCTQNNLKTNNDVKKYDEEKICTKNKKENFNYENSCDENENKLIKDTNSCDLDATAYGSHANAYDTNATDMRFYAKQSKEKQSKEKQRKQKQTKGVINTFDFHPKVFDYTSNKELRDCLCVFFDERGKSKSIDPRFVEMFFKQLDSYSAGDDDKKILILRNSIINGWQNIYPVNLNNKSGLSKLDEYYGTEKRQTDNFTETELRDLLKIKSHL